MQIIILLALVVVNIYPVPALNEKRGPVESKKDLPWSFGRHPHDDAKSMMAGGERTVRQTAKDLSCDQLRTLCTKGAVIGAGIPFGVPLTVTEATVCSAQCLPGCPSSCPARQVRGCVTKCSTGKQLKCVDVCSTENHLGCRDICPAGQKPAFGCTPL